MLFSAALISAFASPRHIFQAEISNQNTPLIALDFFCDPATLKAVINIMTDKFPDYFI